MSLVRELGRARSRTDLAAEQTKLYCTVDPTGTKGTAIMELLHRKLQQGDTRTGRDCQFCKRFDPQFGKRDPMDRLVNSELNEMAAAHITENGYVQHRMLEIGVRLNAIGFRATTSAV